MARIGLLPYWHGDKLIADPEPERTDVSQELPAYEKWKAFVQRHMTRQRHAAWRDETATHRTLNLYRRMQPVPRKSRQYDEYGKDERELQLKVQARAGTLPLASLQVDLHERRIVRSCDSAERATDLIAGIQRDRQCRVCNSGADEDLYHFLFD